MKFLFPGFLYALFTLAIPIIIHLFNFRKYKIFYFSNLKFLQEIKEQTQSKSTLKQLLILISRLLALTALIFAFAQPFIQTQNTKNNSIDKQVSIYLDNSFSMNGVTQEGDLFEVGRQYAYQIENAYNSSQKFQFLTNDFLAKQQRLYDKQGYQNLVDEAMLGPHPKTLPEIVSRQLNLLNKNPETAKDLFYISDFQESTFAKQIPTLDSLTTVYLIDKQPQPIGNVAVDSVWFNSPVRKLGQPEILHIKIKNYHNQPTNDISVKLTVQNQVKTTVNISLEAFEEKIVELSYTQNNTGIIHGNVEIDDFPITFDNILHFSYQINDACQILAIYDTDSSTALQRVFKTDNYFKLSQTKSKAVNYSELTTYNLIILNELNDISSGLFSGLTQYLEAGGNLVYIPSPKLTPSQHNQFIEKLNLGNFIDWQNTKNNVNNINIQHPVYQGVFEKIEPNIDLPTIHKYLQFKPNPNSKPISLLTLETNDVFLCHLNQANKSVFMFTSSFSDSSTNFTNHALIVPTMLQIGLFSGINLPLYYTINNQTEILLPNNLTNKNTEVFTIHNHDNSIQFIPEARQSLTGTKLLLHNQLNTAGIYFVSANKKQQLAFALNYSRKESSLNVLTTNEVKQIFEQAGANVQIVAGNPEQVGNAIKQSFTGTPLWQWFIALALIFLIIEIALIRFLN